MSLKIHYIQTSITAQDVTTKYLKKYADTKCELSWQLYLHWQRLADRFFEKYRTEVINGR